MRPMCPLRETAPSPPGGFSLRPLPFRIARAAQRHVESGSRHADRTSPEAGSLDDAGRRGGVGVRAPEGGGTCQSFLQTAGGVWGLAVCASLAFYK